MPFGRQRQRSAIESIWWCGRTATPSKHHEGHEDRILGHIRRTHHEMGPVSRCVGSNVCDCDEYRLLCSCGPQHKKPACRCPACSKARAEKLEAAERQRQHRAEKREEKISLKHQMKLLKKAKKGGGQVVILFKKLTEEERKAKAREKSRKWRADNPEKSKAASKKWRNDNPEKAKAAKKAWRDKNPEYWKAYHRRKDGL